MSDHINQYSGVRLVAAAAAEEGVSINVPRFEGGRRGVGGSNPTVHSSTYMLGGGGGNAFDYWKFQFLDSETISNPNPNPQ
jgi:hypothetical protein